MRFVHEFWLYLVPLLPLLWLGLRAADRNTAARLTTLLGPEAERQVVFFPLPGFSGCCLPWPSPSGEPGRCR